MFKNGRFDPTYLEKCKLTFVGQLAVALHKEFNAMTPDERTQILESYAQVKAICEQLERVMSQVSTLNPHQPSQAQLMSIVNFRDSNVRNNIMEPEEMDSHLQHHLDNIRDLKERYAQESYDWVETLQTWIDSSIASFIEVSTTAITVSVQHLMRLKY